MQYPDTIRTSEYESRECEVQLGNGRKLEQVVLALFGEGRRGWKSLLGDHGLAASKGIDEGAKLSKERFERLFVTTYRHQRCERKRGRPTNLISDERTKPFLTPSENWLIVARTHEAEGGILQVLTFAPLSTL